MFVTKESFIKLLQMFAYTEIVNTPGPIITTHSDADHKLLNRFVQLFGMNSKIRAGFFFEITNAIRSGRGLAAKLNATATRSIRIAQKQFWYRSKAPAQGFPKAPKSFFHDLYRRRSNGCKSYIDGKTLFKCVTN